MGLPRRSVSGSVLVSSDLSDARRVAANASAVVRLPTPGGPEKIQAWWTLPEAAAALSVSLARACPMMASRSMQASPVGRWAPRSGSSGAVDFLREDFFVVRLAMGKHFSR